MYLHQVRFNFPSRAVCGALTSFKQIAERPHPYNSRQNDIVRHFLLEQLREIAKDHDFIFIRVEDDVQTDAAFLDGSRTVIFRREQHSRSKSRRRRG